MRKARKSLILLPLFVWLATFVASAAVEPVRARKAMVVSVHELASQAGLEILQAGGNAVDAAVATGFALAVVHPAAGNLGGGGFMLVRWGDGRVDFLDYRDKAPKAAHRDMYLDAQANVVNALSTVGYKAIAVPGSVAGMAYAQKKWGKLPLKRVMAAAIRLARDGFALSEREARSLRESETLPRFPESRRIFQRDGRYYEAGEVFPQPELARTLERIAQNPDDFYRGALARELAAALQKGGGLITAEDLAQYEVKQREPIRGNYRGYEIVGAPPPSSGGTTLIEILNILEGYDLAKLGNRSADSIHLAAEVFRRAFFDRNTFLGDPDFVQVPVAQLTDKRYAAAWREKLNPARATESAALERPGFDELDRMAVAPAMLAEGTHTTHYSVVDADGNAVAVTTTLNSGYGSGVTAEGLGFLLNNEMDDFTSKPGTANQFGLVESEANAIAPGKRPLSAMTPTIVVKDGKLFLVGGSPGGPRIITTMANIITGVIDFGLNLQEAVNAPRFHHQWMPDSIRVEREGFSADTLLVLQQRGHEIVPSGRKTDKSYPDGYWSDGECIMVDRKSGELLGATDIRNARGAALGY